MKKLILAFALLLRLPLGAQQLNFTSPDRKLMLSIDVGTGGFQYALRFGNSMVILPSRLSVELREPNRKLESFDLLAIDSTDHLETWKPVLGEYAAIEDHHRELGLHLKDRTTGILVNIVFRLFNEGMAFRYEYPKQDQLNNFILAEEHSTFRLTGDHKTFWIPGDYDSNEYAYYTTNFSAIDATKGRTVNEISVKSIFDPFGVQTPLMMKTSDGLYINIHEAALRNYPAMQLVADTKNLILYSHLVPDAVNNAAYLTTPATSPWRTIVVSDKATNILAANRMILNLNEPPAIENTGWIKPQKMIGVWWEMHVTKSGWPYNNGSGVHGANTSNVKRYIDFAARNKIDAVLVEGWNTGWENWYGNWKEDVFDFVTPYPDYDLSGLTKYAAAKGVKIVMHHETSAAVTSYERRMDTAYRLMTRYGMNTVKTGYVGRIIPRGEHHDGQWMVKHYERVMAATAGYHIMLDAHEPVRPTGLSRTFPNFLACEAARGNEFNAWSIGNPPEHETILPFTRLMGGPMDYTPGIFQTDLSVYAKSKTERVHTTLAKQLALYVTMYSPLQMAADLPENYEAHMDAFAFIRDVATDWDDTRYLQAEPGDYIVVARKAKHSPEWFMGAITDEVPREFDQDLSFLDRNRNYVATIYRDADDADWLRNPMAYTIENLVVNSKQTLKLKLAAGGGTAIRLRPATDADIRSLKKLQ